MKSPDSTAVRATLDLSEFFEGHPVIDTERLVLREITLADASDLHVYYADPECRVFQSGTAVKYVEETEGIIRQVAREFSVRKAILLGLERKSDGRIIGDCDVHHLSLFDRRMEVGYGLAREYWGFGYMTEALRAVIRFAFEAMGFHRIEAECETTNFSACRVATRCGMTLEATLRENEINKGRFISNNIYAILRH